MTGSFDPSLNGPVLVNRGEHGNPGTSRLVTTGMRLAVLAIGAVLLVGCSSATDTPSDSPSSSRSVVDTTTAAQPLLASFTFDFDQNVTSPTSCPITAIRLTDRSRGEPTAWLWAFPDGSISTEQNPVIHGDMAFGDVQLTVTRGDDSDTITKLVSEVVC